MSRRLALWLPVFLVAGFLPLAGQRNRTEYALVLEDPPLTARIQSRKDLMLAATEDRRRQIEAAQTTLRAELERRGFQVVGAVHVLENAVFVRASADKLGELRSLPGVRQVASLPPAKLRMDKAAGLVNAPAAWSALGGTENAGAGIKIGLLDTGIDQNHPAFQDASLTAPTGFPKCAGADCSYTSNKVIVARSYVSVLAAGSPGDPAADSRPDDLSPRDRMGHGTALGMIAAGHTNTTPGGVSITGIAPKAFLGNYKIFGSPGLLDYTYGSVIIQALEDAFLDGMDIVSLSLGSPAVYGPLDKGAVCSDPAFPDPTAICDIRADAVQNAVANGMLVVVAAGNDADLGVNWPMLNTINTPGTAPAALTVGSTNNSHRFFSSVRLPGNDVPAGLVRIDTFFGDGPKPPTPVTAPLRDVQSLGNDGMACSALPGGSLSGMIALVQRGVCLFSDKVNNAQAAGAVGVVLYLDNPADTLFTPQGLFQTGIPAVMIENAPGTALKSFLATHDQHTVTLDPSLIATDDPLADTVTFFSSRGPSIGQNAIKPEIVAPGTFVFSATQSYDPNSDMYDASGYNAFSGTSFPTPMVAGAAALVHQRNPGASPADLKSALVNTATVPLDDPGIGPASVTAVGGGKLNVADAIRSTITVDPATLSFGAVTTTWPLPLRPVTIKNLGATQVTLTLSATQPLTLSTTSVTVNPGSTTVVNVGLSGDRPAAGSYEGVVTITGGAVPLHVPYLYLVGNGIPGNAIALSGDGFVGIADGATSPGLLAIKVVDRFGVPVNNVPVTFSSTTGGSIGLADAHTDVYGIAAAQDLILGPQPGEQQFTATAGGMTVSFSGIGMLSPIINAGGVVNAATGEAGQGVAPNSYIAIYGSALSPTTRQFSTLYLPLSLAGVSVSFDAPPLSLPGRLTLVSPGQINLQAPPELKGLSSVQMKVSIGDFSTDVYTVPLKDYSPAIFQYPINSGLAAATYNGGIVGLDNPFPRGQVVELYVNGLGPLDHDIPAGEPAPLSPLSRTTTTPTVTIGGKQAQVMFSGLTPTCIGLYQVNALVPNDAGTGRQPVIITIGGVSSKQVDLPLR